ncbi:unnamed protein product [Amoebophrya sp. A25]|nr:unnamed protein product [Amoebophrya sp. A25]|eukprot:GSA25T00004063001.1
MEKRSRGPGRPRLRRGGRPLFSSALMSSSWLLLLSLLLRSSFLVVDAILDPSAEEKRQLWGSPNCDNAPTDTVDWVAFREEMSRIPYPHNIELVIPLFHQFRISHVLDAEAQKCVMGLSTLFFFTCRWTLDSVRDQGRVEEDTDWRGLTQAISQYSVLENYLSAVHPGLLDNSLWPIMDSDIRRLRQDLLDTYRTIAQRDVALQDAMWHNRLRIYVYDEEEVPLLKKLTIGAMFCGRGQWGMETQIHDFFRAASFRTLDPYEADFFYVPGYAICMLEGNIWKMEEIDQIYIDLVKALPFFERSRGRDHIFTFGSGMSTSVFESWRDHIPEAIVLTPETELFNDLAWIIEPPFQPFKDIVIPGNLDMTELISLQEFSKPLEEREFLGCFFGRADVVRGPHPWVGGPMIRKTILGWKDEPDLFISEFTELKKMHEAMGNSKFCFIPRGKSAWSLRFFESLFTNCVPVLLSDLWELPFEDFLDVSKFVIKWPAANTDGLLQYLRSIPDTIVENYMAEARRVRCWFQYPPKKVDVRHTMRKAHNLCQDESMSAYNGILQILMHKKRSGVSSGWRRDQYNLIAAPKANINGNSSSSVAGIMSAESSGSGKGTEGDLDERYSAEYFALRSALHTKTSTKIVRNFSLEDRKRTREFRDAVRRLGSDEFLRHSRILRKTKSAGSASDHLPT